MPYKVTIQSEQYKPLAGVIYFWSGGEQIGEAHIPAGGATLTDDEVNAADRYTVESDGYSYYGTSTLYEDNIFTLARKPKTGLYIALALAGGFVLSKLIKFRI